MIQELITIHSTLFPLDWQQFVINKLRGWELMNLNWARNFTGNVKVVFYDDLLDNLEQVIRDILIFLEFPVNEVSFGDFTSFSTNF